MQRNMIADNWKLKQIKYAADLGPLAGLGLVFDDNGNDVETDLFTTVIGAF